ncbi:MAG: polysaccharide deacetylase family protein [Gaiellales bacterium]
MALSLVLNIEEGSERSFAFGDGANDHSWESSRPFPAQVRDMATESVYEYGSRAGVHRVLRVLREAGVRCTTFSSAVALAVNPEATEQIITDGHEICGHGWRWTEQWTLTREQERQHILDAVDLLERVTGERPTGWYSRYGPSVNTRELLMETGFCYDSDAYNDDLPYGVESVGPDPYVVVPYTMTYNDGRFGDRYASPDSFMSYLRRGLALLLREGETSPRMMSIGMHPRIIGQAARADVLREFIEHAQGTGAVWFARRDEIAELWRSRPATSTRPRKHAPRERHA